MTLENFNYRTDPLFLRNKFISFNDFGIPDIPKPVLNNDELRDLLLLGFNQVNRDNGEHSERIVHFFLYDYNFEKVWENPESYVESLSNYKGILTPDFSMYLEMPYSIQLYNTFRNRWCGAYFASEGIRVIPTVSWADEKSFEFCFKGIEKGSIVAVSTYMFHETNHHKDQKDIFMKGYNRMLSEIEPEKIICYSEPFSEMTGDIVYVDYELSSWKYINQNTTNPLKIPGNCDKIITKYCGYVCKGGGSAFGGEWKPKDANSEKFLGEPDSIRVNTMTTRKGSYNVIDKYNSEGKAVIERHLTDHNKPGLHSNPHDHIIDWSKNHPDPSPPINYFDKEVPSFEEVIEEYLGKSEKNVERKFYYMSINEEVKNLGYNPDYNPDDYKFETLGEFKQYLDSGWNIGFDYKGVEYGIEGHYNSFDIWIYDGDFVANGLTLEQTLDLEFDGVKLRDFITTDDVIITERLA